MLVDYHIISVSIWSRVNDAIGENPYLGKNHSFFQKTDHES